jgi:hypothetical protein
MDNEEPVFATTARRRQADHEVALADANPHQVGHSSMGTALLRHIP